MFHVLQIKKLRPLEQHCRKMLEDSELQVMPHCRNESLKTQEAVRAVWEILLEIAVKGGPFAFRDKERKLPELIDRDCHLYPYGPPASGSRWIRTAGRSNSDYAEFLSGVFLKTLESTVASRRYSVEKSCAYLYLRNCFSLTHATIVPGFDIPFWPGGQICVDEQDEDYKGERKKRSEKVTAFI